MKIPGSASAQLKSLWSKILQASGADFDPSTDFRDYIATSDEAPDLADYPFVTPIVFNETLSEVISFNQNVIEFVGDESTYVCEVENSPQYDPNYIESLAANIQGLDKRTDSL